LYLAAALVTRLAAADPNKFEVTGWTLNQVGAFSLTATDSAQTPVSGLPFATQILSTNTQSPTFTLLSALMTKPRTRHTATLLNTGQVLIAGGWNGLASEASAELYDPATRSFTETGSMTEPRYGHTATLLAGSSSAVYAKVLIVGSEDKTAELYDPRTGTFARTGSMHHARIGPTATLLDTGKVLIAGGNTTSGDLTAELYDPISKTFSDTGSMTILRTGHTSTLLQDGSVLIAGGSVTSTASTATAERYNPATGKFTRTGSMTIARAGHTATRLSAHDGTESGEVLIAGSDTTADLYNPAKGTFTAVGSPGSYDNSGLSRTASLRNDGTVLVVGGYVMESVHVLRLHYGTWICTPVGELPVSELYASTLFVPANAGFSGAGFLNVRRDGHSATVLPDGSVLIVGGINHTVFPRQYFAPCTKTYPEEIATVLSSAELFE
jgi:hypothetical protein